MGWNNRAQNTPLLPTRFSFFTKAIQFVALFSMFAVFFVISSKAATYTVTTTADNESNGCGLGQCTLREAITSSNALLGSDTILFQNGLTGTIILSGSHLPITSDITITGPGARNLSVSGNNASRVFVVSGSGTDANISGLTITGGNAQLILIGSTLIGDGGGILNTDGGTLTLTEVAVSGNSATSLGGGIATRAFLFVTTTTNIVRSVINNNSAIVGGGGICNLGTALISSAATTISNTTITDNSALAEGGGISNTAGTMNLVNTTISHNQSTIAGGGIVNVGGVLVGVVNMRNTLLAQNNALVGLDLLSSDALGVFNSLGHNLVGNNLDVSASFSASVFISGSPQPNVKADLVGSIAIGFQRIDPLMGSLTNNGGITDTRSISSASPAMNRGDNCVSTNTCSDNPGGNNPSYAMTTDQNGTGYPRVYNGTTDIGAYESQIAPTAANVTVSGRVSDSFGRTVSKARVTVTDSSGQTRTATTNNFGFYRFDEISGGETHTFQVIHKQHQFTPQVVNISENISDLHFVAQDN